MSLSDETRNLLKRLGAIQSSENLPRSLQILIALLRSQGSPMRPLSFGELYGAMQQIAGSDLTRAWVHRVLKGLVDDGIVKTMPGKGRARYYTDVDTIADGLERMREARMTHIREEVAALHAELVELEKCDCTALAERLYMEVTGTSSAPCSRLLKGIDEFHDVTSELIYRVARQGDVIRTCPLWVSEFVENALVRLSRLLVAAEQGVEIRYLLTSDAFVLDDVLSANVDFDGVRKFLAKTLELRRAGKKLDVRVYFGPKDTYQFVALNSERIAFLLAREPITAVYFTRAFNADLIDATIATFDVNWENAVSMFDPTVLERFPRRGFILDALLRSFESDGSGGPGK